MTLHDPVLSSLFPSGQYIYMNAVKCGNVFGPNQHGGTVDSGWRLIYFTGSASRPRSTWCQHSFHIYLPASRSRNKQFFHAGGELVPVFRSLSLSLVFWVRGFLTWAETSASCCLFANFLFFLLVLRRLLEDRDKGILNPRSPLWWGADLNHLLHLLQVILDRGEVKAENQGKKKKLSALQKRKAHKGLARWSSYDRYLYYIGLLTASLAAELLLF